MNTDQGSTYGAASAGTWEYPDTFQSLDTARCLVDTLGTTEND